MLQQELLRSRELRAQAFGTYRAGERRRVIVALSLLCSDLVSAFVAFSLVDIVFGLSWTETALTALPVLIGLFWVSGLYSSDTLPPGERLRARLLGTLAFVGTFLVVSGRVLRVKRSGSRPRCQGVLVFLLGYYAEALTRHALIRRKLWGAPTVFAGSGDAIEQARRCSPQFPSLACDRSAT